MIARRGAAAILERIEAHATRPVLDIELRALGYRPHEIASAVRHGRIVPAGDAYVCAAAARMFAEKSCRAGAAG